ncbi:MAG: 4-hydroxybenzoate octaprenyltransferase [Betaproteobacteria bacterium]|nr:4-hydroxybenzoate octaprenyltransferase [Betaproteobacteria bacterium]MBI2961830.1 4-hydroxybenzoate octaprenyltransferase [Betaproteobacteria bacterium]
MNFAAITAKLDAYERLIRLDKPIGFMLLMWPTLWALWIASRGEPDPLMVWIFVLGSVLTRSAGVIANDLADMRYDGLVKRTRDRPLVTGAVSRAEAIVFGVLLLLACFVLVLQLNKLTVQLSFIAVAIAGTYPFFKRFFFLPQAYLGIAFGFGMPMAFAACLDQLPPIVWEMLVANIFWAIAYDTEYAMVDRDDDMNLGMRTSAITFGRFDVLAVMVCYGAMLAILAAVGMQLNFGVYYYLGLAAAAASMGHHYVLIRGRARQGCFRAFRYNNWVGAAIFAGIVLEHFMRGR